jgi:hypothetical protein
MACRTHGMNENCDINEPSTRTKLTYDALGRMVAQSNGSTEILYSPAGKAALMNGQTLVKAFVPLPGGATAIYNSTGLAYYRHSDWLGSSRLTSTAARTVYSSSAYAPFGEQYAVSGTSDPSFTGQNSDTAVPCMTSHIGSIVRVRAAGFHPIRRA